jgi:hypothetical protein
MNVMDIDNVYKQIDEQRSVLIALLNQAKKNPISPNRLSDVCMKLSILNELLGGFVADLKRDQLDKEAELYDQYSSKSATYANNMARIGSKDERYRFMKADTKHSDLWKLISMAQSHIRAEGEERKAM